MVGTIDILLFITVYQKFVLKTITQVQKMADWLKTGLHSPRRTYSAGRHNRLYLLKMHLLSFGGNVM